MTPNPSPDERAAEYEPDGKDRLLRSAAGPKARPGRRAAQRDADAELAAVLTAVYRVHQPMTRFDVTTCVAENGEQEWPCETILACRTALEVKPDTCPCGHLIIVHDEAGCGFAAMTRKQCKCGIPRSQIETAAL